jgi:hypothetical protein
MKKLVPGRRPPCCPLLLGALSMALLTGGCAKPPNGSAEVSPPASKEPARKPVAHAETGERAEAPPRSQPPVRSESRPLSSEHPADQSAIEERQANLNMLGSALGLYLMYNNGELPPRISELFKQGFVLDLNTFVLPTTGKRITDGGQLDALTDYEMVTQLTAERPLLLLREKTSPPGGNALAFYSDRKIRPVGDSPSPQQVVPSVVSLKAKEAKLRLAQAGYSQIRFVAADQPAPSKEQELTIERQTPPAGVAAPTETLIVLAVFSAARERTDEPPPTGGNQGRVVPSVVGLKAKEAKTRLSEAGFAQVRFAAAAQPAPSKEQELTIERQTPPAGSVASSETLMLLVIYSPAAGQSSETPPSSRD